MTVNHIIREMQEVFIHECEALATPSRFRQRASRISAAAWVQGLVFGWLSHPDASLSALARALAVAGTAVSPQAVHKRFGEPGATVLHGVLERLSAYAVQEAARHTLTRREVCWLQGFPALWLRDSTLIPLPSCLHSQWPGTGQAQTQGQAQGQTQGPGQVPGQAPANAGVKVMTQWEWHSGTLASLCLTGALHHDQKAATEQDQLLQDQGRRVQAGEMHVFDLGFFALSWLAELHAQNAYFCCRYKAGTHLGFAAVSCGSWVSCDSWVSWHTSPLPWLQGLPASQERAECEVWLGRKAQVPVRFVAVRVPPAIALQRRQRCLAHSQRKGQKVSEERLALCAWNLFVTNAPPHLLSHQQVGVLYRLRWQIERLFRLWKETLHLDCWRSQNPQRILCEVWAKLLGALLTQKLTAFAAWHDPARSLVKCAHAMHAHAVALLTHLRFPDALKRQLLAFQRACRCAAKLDKRRPKPATFQRIQEVQQSLS